MMRTKFLKYIRSFGNENTASLIEAIESAFNIIFESTVNYPEGFDLNEFKSLKSFNARKKYADQRLQKIGKGSSRIVYKIDDNTVMKMAFNDKGVAQNQVEGDYGLHRMYPDILPDLIDSDDDNLWIIKQFAHKITQSEFKQKTGIKFSDFGDTIRYELNRAHGTRNYFSKPLKFDEVIDDEFVQEVLDMAINFDLLPGDLEKISSFGKIDNKKDPVLTDVGLTRTVWNEHYARR